MKKDKHKLKLIIVTIVAVSLLATATVAILSTFNKSATPDTTQDSDIKASADAKKIEAIKNLNSNPQKARELLLEAKLKYEQLGDKNALVDIESQLFYLDKTQN